MAKIIIFFFFSGFSALVYELLWFRHLGFIFGNTVYAATAVLTAYMAGLALGARSLGRMAERVRNPVRLFGLLEISIGIYAALMPLLFGGIRLAYRAIYQLGAEDLPALTLIRFLMAVLIMLVPTFFMGGTLPVLAQGLARQDEGFGRRLSWLYGVNTLGAVAGLITTGFVLIPKLGLIRTSWAAVAINLTIGFVVIALSRKDTEPARPEQAEAESPAASPMTRTVRLALWGGAAAGFLSLALEVVWFRALVLVFGSTTYSFCVMLAVFLFGIAVGSMMLGWLSDRVKDRALLFAVVFLLIGAHTISSMYSYDTKPVFLLQYLVDHSFTWGSMITAKVLITLSFLLIPTLLFGFAFTLAARMARTGIASSGRAVGSVYWYNTIGAVAGSLIGGFLLLPRLGMQTSIFWLGIASLICALPLALFACSRLPIRAAVGLIPVLVAVAFIARPPVWDPIVLSSGAFFSPWNFVDDGEVRFWDQLAGEDLVMYQEGLTSTVAVTKTYDDELIFTSGGKVEADTSNRGMMIQLLQGHVPMLFHPHPVKVMNLGLGAGVTFGALSCYPTEHLEVIEIEPEVVNVAAAWSNYNHAVIFNPNAKVTINDGRNHFFCTTNKYDVITSDPFEPVVAGAGHLFTVEHFQQARKCLADNGIMGQWLPMYEMSEDDFFTIIKSFATAFPNSLIFFTGTDTIMLGYNNEDAQPDAQAVKAKFEIPAVRDSLAQLGVGGPETILGMFCGELSALLEQSENTLLNRDDFPVIEFRTPKSALRYTTDANAQVLLDSFTDIPDDYVAGYGSNAVVSVRSEHEALRSTLEAVVHRSRGESKEAYLKLKQAHEMAPDNPVIRNELAAALMRSADYMQANGHYEQAAVQYHMLLQIQPKSVMAIYHLFHLHMKAGRQQQAIDLLGFGHQHFPESSLLWGVRAKYETANGSYATALEANQQAIDLAPRRQELWGQREELLRITGDVAGAAEAATHRAELIKHSIVRHVPENRRPDLSVF